MTLTPTGATLLQQSMDTIDETETFARFKYDHERIEYVRSTRNLSRHDAKALHGEAYDKWDGWDYGIEEDWWFRRKWEHCPDCGGVMLLDGVCEPCEAGSWQFGPW